MFIIHVLTFQHVSNPHLYVSDWACANVGRIQALHTKLSGLNNVINNVPLVLQKVRVMVVCCSVVLKMEFVWEERCGVGRKVLSLRMDVKCSGN